MNHMSYIFIQVGHPFFLPAAVPDTQLVLDVQGGLLHEQQRPPAGRPAALQRLHRVIRRQPRQDRDHLRGRRWRREGKVSQWDLKIEVQSVSFVGLT